MNVAKPHTNYWKVIYIRFVSCMVHPIQNIGESDIFGKLEKEGSTSGRSGVPSGSGLHQQSAVPQLSGERNSQMSRSLNPLFWKHLLKGKMVFSKGNAIGAKFSQKCQKRMVLVLWLWWDVRIAALSGWYEDDPAGKGCPFNQPWVSH